MGKPSGEFLKVERDISVKEYGSGKVKEAIRDEFEVFEIDFMEVAPN